MSEIRETEEQVIARHKKEARDLIAAVTGMKKQATKSKKKEVMKKCQDMEEEMKKRHKLELETAINGDTPVVEEVKDKAEEEDEDEFSPEKLLAQLELEKKEESSNNVTIKPIEPMQQGQGKKKRNRQKERLAKRDQEIKRIQEEAALEADQQPDFKAMELENLSQLCKIGNLKQHDIRPDGHCLFASIADQLKERCQLDTTIQSLRSRAANHIRADPQTYAPFLFDEETMTIRDVGEYTEKIENTSMWGGDMEIMALAKEFDCPISVMMSGRATLRINEEGKNPELKLVYYKHAYGLGEHYNSLRDATENDEQ